MAGGTSDAARRSHPAFEQELARLRARPDVPTVVHWEPAPGWRTPARREECMFTRGGSAGVRGRCNRPAVAELLRGRLWWSYCADHLYGCRIMDGVVMRPQRVKPPTKLD